VVKVTITRMWPRCWANTEIGEATYIKVLQIELNRMLYQQKARVIAYSACYRDKVPYSMR